MTSVQRRLKARTAATCSSSSRSEASSGSISWTKDNEYDGPRPSSARPGDSRAPVRSRVPAPEEWKTDPSVVRSILARGASVGTKGCREGTAHPASAWLRESGDSFPLQEPRHSNTAVPSPTEPSGDPPLCGPFPRVLDGLRTVWISQYIS